MTVLKTATIALVSGFSECQRSEVAALYLTAFAPKLKRILGRGPRLHAYVAGCLDPDFAILAVDAATNTIVGIAGYRTEYGGLTNRISSNLRPHYGSFGGFWRGAILTLLELPERSDKLLVDGIAVAASHRDQGVGTKLLRALDDKAVQLGKHGVRLDVVDNNLRARALYERQGYTVTSVHDLGALRLLFGFRRATQMTKML